MNFQTGSYNVRSGFRNSLWMGEFGGEIREGKGKGGIHIPLFVYNMREGKRIIKMGQKLVR